MFTKFDVLETIDMVEKEHLDIRTITMGISLFPCIRDTAEDTAQRVYDLVCRRAEKIVKTAEDLSREYGIPIVNKRVSVTPVSLISAAFPEEAPLIGRALDRAADDRRDRLPRRLFRALVQKGGAADYERKFMPHHSRGARRRRGRLCASVNVASTRSPASTWTPCS